MNADRAAFLEKRKSGIGGSEAAALLGYDRHKSIADVWRRFADLSLPDDEPANGRACERGNARESAVLDAYERRYGIALWRPTATTPAFVHPEHQWMIGNVDAIGARGFPGAHGVDAKTTTESIAADEFGREDTDEIPEEFIFQGQWYCAVTGLDRWDFFVEIASRWSWDYRRFIVRRNDDLIAALIDAGSRLWNDHVLTGIPPEPTDFPSMERLARARFPYASAPMIVADGDADTIALVARYAAAKDANKQAEAEIAETEALLKALIGPAAGITTPIGTITWLPTRSGSRPLKFKPSENRT